MHQVGHRIVYIVTAANVQRDQRQIVGYFVRIGQDDGAALRCGGQLLLDLSAFERYKLHRYGLDGFQISAHEAPFRLQTGSRLQAGLRVATPRWRRPA